MTEAPELSIGGGGSVTMMSKRSSASSRWFRPSAMITRPFGFGEHRRGVRVVVAEHRRDRRDELHGVGPEAGDQRGPERRAHPEGHDQRALGLRPGDQRQDRHQLGVDGQQRHRRAADPQLRRAADLAGLDGRDLVLPGLEELPALVGDARLVGLDEEPGPAWPARRSRSRRRRRPPAERDPARPRPGARGRCPSAALIGGQHDDDRGRAERRHEDERDRRGCRGSRPSCSSPSRQPGRRPAWPRVVAQQRRRGREGEPHHERHRQDDQDAEPNRAPTDSRGRAGSSDARLRRSRGSGRPREDRDGDLRSRGPGRDPRSAAGRR